MSQAARIAIERKERSIWQFAKSGKLQVVVIDVIPGLGRFLGFFDQLFEQGLAVFGVCHDFDLGLLASGTNDLGGCGRNCGCGRGSICCRWSSWFSPL